MSSHHQLIRRLVARIRALQDDQHAYLEDLDYAREQADRLGGQLYVAHQDARHAQEASRQEELDRWSRDDDRQRAIQNLERARSCGDEWAEASALRRLKSL